MNPLLIAGMGIYDETGTSAAILSNVGELLLASRGPRLAK